MKESRPSDRQLDRDLAMQARERTKSMILVGARGRPFLDYLLRNITLAGYRNACIVVGEGDGSVREYYGRKGGHATNLELSFTVQKIPAGRSKPLGAADALYQALQATSEWQGQKFTVCNSDNLYSVRALRLLLEDNHANAMIDFDREALEYDHARIMQFAVIEKTPEGTLVDIMEKPSADQVARAVDRSGRVGVSMNIFRLSYDMIFPVLENVPPDRVRGEKDMPGAVKCLLKKHPNSVFTIPVAEHVVDLTYQTDIPVASQYIKDHFPDF